jgi:Protein of unknown function (DUF3108)
VKAAAFALGLMILAPHATSAPRTVPFRAGETLTYDVSWATFLVAGTVVMTVKDRKPSFDSTAYYIVAEARPVPFLAKLYSLYYKLDTMLDVYSLLPQRGSLYTEEGNRHRLKTTRFDRTARKAFFEDQSTTTIKADFPIAASTLDALSTLYVLRTIPLKAGLHVTMPVTDDGWNYKLTVDVAAPERIKTPIGEIAAWKAVPVVTDDKGQTIGKNLTMWISADARRYPLKIQADMPVGSFVLQLREAK